MILDDLAAYAADRVKLAKENVSFEEIKTIAVSLPKGEPVFARALGETGLSFICEVKKASPSKGVIDPVFNYLDIVTAYKDAGADCISCLTEPKWFLGSDEIFIQIREAVSLPMLRKDFTIDEYQIYEAKRIGANAVLLICALLDTATIARYLEICDGLGLSALVEAHNEEEIRSAVTAGAKIIGVNNRNLKDFTVDVNNAAKLRELVPAGTLFVAESGLQSTEDIALIRSAGVDAVLIGEAMMRAADKKAMLASFREAAK